MCTDKKSSCLWFYGNEKSSQNDRNLRVRNFFIVKASGLARIIQGGGEGNGGGGRGAEPGAARGHRSSELLETGDLYVES